jgi:predicted  nucleic acid-binding Zn-ribbon protein
LEARLAKGDENVLVLRDTIESLELQSDSRRRQVEELDHQLRNLTKDGEGWRASLEEREQRVSELEEKLRQWEEAKDQAADDRARLGGLVGTVSKARESLDMEVSRAQNSDAAEKATTPEDTGLQAQYVALQETHTATLADLSVVSAKYRDALREISDLAAQIAEAKLQNMPVDTPEDVAAPPQYDSMSLGRRRGIGKRLGLEAFEHSGVSVNGSNGGSGNGTGGRRLFFRQAASAESLHARSQSQQSQSQLLSQELSLARTPKHSLTNGNGVSPGSPASSVDSRGHAPKLSLLAPISAPQTPSPEDRGRSVQSLEKEIMRLQEVLKEREAEIGALEGSLKEMNQSQPKQRSTSLTLNGTAKDTDDDDVPQAKTSGGRLSPTTMKRFARLRSSLIIENPPRFPDEPTPEAVDRLDELMRCVGIYIGTSHR